MNRLKITAAMMAASLAVAGCVPIPTIGPVVTTAAPNNLTTHPGGEYSCSIDGTLVASWTPTTFTLSTQYGTEVLTGAFPTYYGDEISATVIQGTVSFNLSAPGEQQFCSMTGLG